MPRKRRTIKVLSGNIRDSIIGDVADVAEYHARPDRTREAGFFSIPRNVFCYVDYLGYVTFGYRDTNRRVQSTKCAVEYLEKYFPPGYAEFAALIYAMWRHGTVHRYEPSSFYASDPSSRPKKIQVMWFSSNGREAEDRKGHLSFFPMQGKRGRLYLKVNTCQLVDDLLYSLDKLVDVLKRDPTRRKECEKRLNEFGRVEDFVTVEGKAMRTKVGQQIRLAAKRRRREKINNRGNIVV
jgi:hypothetical protein